MKLNKKILSTALVLYHLSSTAGELTFPVEPPSSQQLQRPASSDTVTGATIPITLKQKIAKTDETSDHIIEILKQILANKPTINLLTNSVKTPQTLAGGAGNIAAQPISAQLTIQLTITGIKTPLLGADFIPVSIQLIDQQGKIIEQKSFDYRTAKETQFTQAIEQMLTPHIGQTRKLNNAEPQLKTWIETENGKPIKVGSGLAIYFQTDTKGYVSLYHFSHDKTVQRLYPSTHEPINFVQPGVIYRYPAKDYLRVSGKPGEDLIKAIFTRWSSNMPRVVDGLSSKTAPLNIIPTHFPVLFANGEMSRFFALPKTHYTESHLHYQISQ